MVGLAGACRVNAHRLAELMPAAKVELFDATGHLFWWEDPERAAALLAAVRRGG